MSLQNLLDLSLPFAEVIYNGTVCVAKAEGTGGVLNFSTCAEQLLYEIGDPSSYITPDVIIDVRDVKFQPLSNSKVLCSGAKPAPESIPQQLLLLRSKESGWKGWGEISYGGYESVQRAKAAEFLVRAWIEELYPGISNHVVSYIIGLDSLKATCMGDNLPSSEDIRLRMDGLFEKEEHALQFVKEFTALYTNGPAGGGGISTGCKKEIFLDKELVGREHVHWHIAVSENNIISSIDENTSHTVKTQKCPSHESDLLSPRKETTHCSSTELLTLTPQTQPAPAGQKIPLYDIAHSRVGDKGNDINFSLIPHHPPDIEKLNMIVTPNWVKEVVSNLMNQSSFPSADDIEKRDKWVDEHVKVEIYEVRGTHSLNVVVRNILDGGVNCSRRIDRHGKSMSDVILCQKVSLPP